MLKTGSSVADIHPYSPIVGKLRRTDRPKEGGENFSLHIVGELIKKRKLQFLQKIVSSSNNVCNLFMSVAVRESELVAANT